MSFFDFESIYSRFSKGGRVLRCDREVNDVCFEDSMKYDDLLRAEEMALTSFLPL
jgi:hypothetical protein